MSKDCYSIFRSFKLKIDTIDKIRIKQEKLFSKNEIVKRDIEIVYSSLFLNTIIYVEALIEEIFIGLLSNLIIINKTNINVRIKINIPNIAREAVCNGRSYFSWLPYENTLKIARLYFTGGRPFSILSIHDKNDLKKCLIIRNAIAHKSRSALNKFDNEILSGIYLRTRDRKPNSFLRYQYSQNPNINYYQYYVLKLLNIVNTICSNF